jgi:exoribonuclease R
LPRGVLRTLLGPCGDLEIEKKALLMTYNPFKMPKEIKDIYEDHSFLKREECPEQTFNIDPLGCRDIDDCITLWDNKMAISIADVSAWVELNSWMKKAEYMGTSLYKEGVCVKPMFPKVLSEDYMSLVEGQERLAYSLIIRFDETISYEFKETIVKVNKSYTYESVYNDTNFNYTILKDYVYRLSGLVTDDSHKWIEILMLYYNSKAGEILKKNNCGILRSQSGIKLEMAKQFEEFSDSYNYLCYESAKYCLPDSNTNHSMLQVGEYAHASSPIRRYVDIINQFALKGKEFSYECIERFNSSQKLAKSYERELIYIDLYNNKRVLEGIVLNSEKIFIPVLKKIVTLQNNFEKKTLVKLIYYMNPQGNKWKEKIIFQILR